MKIYFACSISGGRKDEIAYQYMVQVLIEMGIDVPTAHIAETGIDEVDARETLELFREIAELIEDQ